MKKNLLSALIFFVMINNAYAVTLGEIINPTEEFLECDNLEWYEQIVCEKVAGIVNTELRKANIQLESGNVIIRRNPVPGLEPRNDIAGGDCHSLDLLKSQIRLTLKESSSLDLSFESISKPIIITAQLLANAWGRVDLEEQRGYEIPNPLETTCAPLPDDDFYMSVNADLYAKQIYFFSLEPKMKVMPNGDVEISIKPIFDIVTSFQIDQNWDIGGRDSSWLTSIYNSVMLLTNTPVNTVEWITGQDDWDEFTGQLIFDHGIFILDWTDLQTFNYGADALVQYFAEAYVESEADKQAGILEENLEDIIYSQIKAALDLDENGEIIFTIPKSEIDGRLFSAIIPALTLLK